MLQVHLIRKQIQVAEEQYIPSPEDEWNAPHCVQIEDRLAGTIYEGTWNEYHTKNRFNSIKFDFLWSDDSKYTKEKTEKLGHIFE